MDCQAYINLMSRYIDEDLRDDEKELWEKHMQDCSDCNVFFKGFQSSIELVSYLKEKCPPDAVRTNMENMFVEMAKNKQKSD